MSEPQAILPETIVSVRVDDTPAPLPAPVAIEALADVLARLGRLLLSAGCSTHRVEDCLRYTAATHGASSEVAATPTGLSMSVYRHADGAPRVRIVRVKRWSIALDRLAEVDRIYNEFAALRLNIGETHAALDALEGRPASVGPLALTFAGGAASASAAVLFGGDWLLALLGGGVGLLSTALGVTLGKREGDARLLVDFLAGILVGIAAWIATSVDPTLPRKPLVLAGLIVNVPGLGLTAGLSELAQKNLVSGAARLLDATMIGVSLLFGVGAMAALERRFSPDHVIELASVVNHAPFWVILLSSLVAAVAFIVFFSVPAKDTPAAVMAALIAWGASYASSKLGITGAAAAFVGALAVGIFANENARRRNRPAQLLLVPGIVMLVPGAFGFVSVDQLLWGNPAQGAAGLVQTVVIAGALALGLVLAGALRPPRKFL